MPTVYTTYIAENLFDDDVGLGEVIVLRKKSPVKVEAGIFLVDVYCLGIRDAFLYQGTESEFMKNLSDRDHTFREMPGGYGRKLVEEAINYAKQFGFAPNKSYKKATRVFGGLKAADDLEGFTFGRDGKPFYIQSEAHDANDVQRILAKLRKVCGEDGFNFLHQIKEEEDNDDDDDESIDDVEQCLLLSEAWLSSTNQQEKPVDQPTEAAKRKFSEFVNRSDFADKLLRNNDVWETSDGTSTFDCMLQTVETILATKPADVDLEHQQVRYLFLNILIFLMSVFENDEDEIDACLDSLQALDGMPPGFKCFARKLIDDESTREVLGELVHPSPEITIMPLSLELIDEASGHYLLICIETYDPEVADQ